MSEKAMAVRKLTAEEARDWSPVTDRIAVSDEIDQAREPEAEMTVGFARVGEGEALDISFPYDEVLVLTKGAYRVEPENGAAVTARPGDVIYLPAGSSSASYAEEDSEMVYVAGPPAVYAEHLAASAASPNERITAEVTSWPGVEAATGERGEWSFKLGRREIGHLHGDRVLHLGFPKKEWFELYAQGRIDYHPVFPGKPGFASRLIEDEADVEDAIALLRLNYDRAVERHGLPDGAGSTAA
jgi:quercetin dioxygenase-like cupin family protein